MSNHHKHELTICECNTLRRQLKEAYNKCTAIYEALITLDNYSTKEQNLLENLIYDLRQTLENEFERNMELSKNKIQTEINIKYLQNELNHKTNDLNQIQNKYRKIYIQQQQEKFIQDNLMKKN